MMLMKKVLLQCFEKSFATRARKFAVCATWSKTLASQDKSVFLFIYFIYPCN